MEKKEQDGFNVLEDLNGYIFSYEDVKELNAGELERFRTAVQKKQIKFIAGRVTKKVDGKFVHRYVNKSKMLANKMDVSKSYYKFVKGWKDPDEVAFKVLMEKQRHERYWEIRTYADTIDRAVEEAEAKKERRADKKLEYELDDNRGWLVFDEKRDGKVRRRGPGKRRATTVDKLTWDEEEKEDE